MRIELAETPERLADQWPANDSRLEALIADLAAGPDAPWWTVARGSSSHAAAFLAAIAGQFASRVVGEIAPSLFTVYGRSPNLAGQVLIAVSQSGAGEDINAVVEAARETGALTVGLTNDMASPLADRAAHTLDLAMGDEKAVAATKTCLGTLALSARLVARLAEDGALHAALEHLPATLAARRDHEPPLGADVLAALDGPGFVLGRGVGLGIAREIALKCKEVCVTPAEAFSSAEFRHGPLTLVGPGTPVLVVCLDDATRPGVLETAERLAGLGAAITLLGPDLPDAAGGTGCRVISRSTTGHVVTDAIALLFDVYGALEARAVASGHDPDQPPNVGKITSTY